MEITEPTITNYPFFAADLLESNLYIREDGFKAIRVKNLDTDLIVFFDDTLAVPTNITQEADTQAGSKYRLALPSEIVCLGN